MPNLPITISLDSDYIRQVISGAGSRYWARDFAWTDRERLGFTLAEHNDSRDESKWTVHTVTHYNVVCALGVLASNAPERMLDLLSRSDDMWTGDAILQMCCFGEFKYG